MFDKSLKLTQLNEDTMAKKEKHLLLLLMKKNPHLYKTQPAAGKNTVIIL